MYRSETDPDKLTETQRSDRQNRALHLMFKVLSAELNLAGLDMRRTLRADVEIPWTPTNVKEFIWRPIQQAQLGKVSTKELTTGDIDRVFETLLRHLANKFQMQLEFPSIETLMYKKRDEWFPKDS